MSQRGRASGAGAARNSSGGAQRGTPAGGGRSSGGGAGSGAPRAGGVGRAGGASSAGRGRSAGKGAAAAGGGAAGTGGRSAGQARTGGAGRPAAAPGSARSFYSTAGRGGGRSAGGRSNYDPARAVPKDKGLGGEQVEGRQAVRELLIAGRRKVYEIWISSELPDNEVIDDIVDLAQDQRVTVHEVSRKKLESEARSEAPQGVLARAAQLPETPFDDLIKRRAGRAPFLIAVDGVTDPGNLGALIRCADGAGVDGLILPRHRAVHVTPTVAKASAGAIEHMAISIVPGLPTSFATLKKAGVWIVGLDDAADKSLFELGDLALDGICLVFGAEGAGLSRLVREQCDLVVSIPMRGRVSSLNVSAAAALACYEVTRQRLQ